ncbi:hypothetical protein IFM89_027942 [Coptis chinensis]|uniref:Reverse transcriptase zinc-binding domain-containing protein n=1 Tax=Coptis chinensis TaxID=261450 RepID=A0A835IHV8_9MAGN|nr:hypothetical protein IFM89_027942 [Coptis chinensis]
MKCPTVASAHEAVRAKGNKIFWASFLWNAILHPRTAAIGWKIFRGTMHTDDKLQSMKFKLASRCITCKQQCETQQHLLYECEFAKKCWNYITTTFQLQQSQLLISKSSKPARIISHWQKSYGQQLPSLVWLPYGKIEIRCFMIRNERTMLLFARESEAYSHLSTKGLNALKFN